MAWLRELGPATESREALPSSSSGRSPADPRQKSPDENENGSSAPSLQRSATVHRYLRSPRKACSLRPTRSREAGERAVGALGSGRRSSMGGALGHERNLRSPAARQRKNSRRHEAHREPWTALPALQTLPQRRQMKETNESRTRPRHRVVLGSLDLVSEFPRVRDPTAGRRTVFRPASFDSWTLPGVLKWFATSPRVAVLKLRRLGAVRISGSAATSS